MTTPRLELSAAVVASRLDKTLLNEIDIPVDESAFWTDSTCVISYIRNNDKRFHTFVANRIAIIHDATFVMSVEVCGFRKESCRRRFERSYGGFCHFQEEFRGKFWILKARTAVRRVVIDCFDCKRRQAPLGKQKMADLPTDRVMPTKPPFTFVGIDCFGRFFVRRGRSLVKTYGVLFTCMSIRAIHLEVSQSLDTDSFINAMRRFIARRGQPEEVRSDNGGSFVRGEKELREAIEGWNQHKIGEFLLQQNVKWTFNPPGGSHHGGV